MHEELGVRKSQAQDAETKYQDILNRKKRKLIGKLRDDDLEARQAVLHAYEVLVDPKQRALYDQGGSEAVQAGTLHGIEIRFVSEECRVVLERVVKAGLAMKVFFSRDEDEIFVTLGAAESILMDEASYAKDPEGGGNNPMSLPLKLKYKDPSTGETDDRPNGTLCNGLVCLCAAAL